MVTLTDNKNDNIYKNLNIHKIILSRNNIQKWDCNIKNNKNHRTLKKENIGPCSGGLCTVLFL
jgi:hypothetical protein